MSRLIWPKYFLGLAEAAAARGDCSRRQVGAVLIRPDRTVASIGFNGTPPGGKSCLKGECPRAQSGVEPGSSYDTGPGACIATHAEANALLFARENTTGYSMAVSCPSCEGCLKLMASARLTEVFWEEMGAFIVQRLAC